MDNPRNKHHFDRSETAKLREELIERSDKMSETEFSVKAQRLRNLGGYWPRGLSDWETAEGRSLRAEIRVARRAQA